jgi:hypothetical protein
MEVFVKDMGLHKFCAKFPEVEGDARRMREMLPDGYDSYLVDYIVMDCEPGMKTCRDTRWHLDGDHRGDNRYALMVTGPNRTEFLEEVFDFGELPDGREIQNAILEERLAGRKARQVADGEIVLYDSRTPHRGVACIQGGRRAFLRLLATNQVRAKNIVRRGEDVPFRSAV